MDDVQDYNGKTFSEIFSEQFYCPKLLFRPALFLTSLYRVSLPVSLLIYLFNRRYFQRDLELVRDLGFCSDREMFYNRVVRFHQETDQEIDTRRKKWKLRVSGRHLLALEAAVLKKRHNAVVQEQMNRSFV